MSDQKEIPNPSMEEDAYWLCNLVRNGDGSLTRRGNLPTPPAIPEIEPDSFLHIKTLSRDIPVNPNNKTYIRLYRPRNIPPETKLPLIIYFHGGGFFWLGSDNILSTEVCNRMAAHIPAVIACVEYRPSPENRLPAAYEDAVECIIWAKTQASAAAAGGDGACDSWMKELVDFSRVFLKGRGAGGNIAYHAALRVVDLDIEPMKIVGLIMNQPFFGGLQRTESEIKYGNDQLIPLHVTDLMWSLTLPEGADRGHEYCDPLNLGSYGDNIGRLPTSVVRTYEGDILVDRLVDFAKMLEARGVHVVCQVIEGGYHAVDLIDPIFSQAFNDDIRDLVTSIAVVE
ncbi:hypothetical protein OROGR_029982 [Orobanche gracilis]